MSSVAQPPTPTPYVIGVDSDGTVFNSMEIKHKRVFQPLAIEIWGLQSVESEFNEIAETINLYSIHRGINRFEGLAMAFRRLTERGGAPQGVAGTCSALEAFLEAGLPFSAQSLADFNSTQPNPHLERVLEWSWRSDELYEKITGEEGNPAYPQAVCALESFARRAEIMVISSSARGALEKDWGAAGLLSLTVWVAGQEMGNKTAQLREGVRQGQDPHRVLMIGDAPGDLEAARANGMLFYPILPGAEEQSWRHLQDTAVDRFFQGTYTGEYQDFLVEDFLASLGGGAGRATPLARQNENSEF